MSRILVVGGTGLVGAALVRAWSARGDETVSAARRPGGPGRTLRLDLTDAAAVRKAVADLRPAIVAVPAANPHVDYCQAHPEETRAVNVAGPLNAARAARAAGARTVFFSSDYVFDGVRGAYTEEDAPNPLNEYGRQKAEAEAGVLAADPRALVIRTSGVYGWQEEPKNFVLQVRVRLAAGETLRVASDLLYNPTWAENLAEVVVALAAAGSAGIFHVAGPETLARSEFAVRIARAFGLDPALLEAVPAAAFGSATPRPKESGLRTDKVRAAVAVPLIGVDEGLRRMRALESEPRI
ncbi:MAG: SDR family oxidoreductase [Elusimicrobia bacterium]|nr:SDR family oxidoreductase [Elusimicrobiota bacterium]